MNNQPIYIVNVYFTVQGATVTRTLWATFDEVQASLDCERMNANAKEDNLSERYYGYEEVEIMD